MKRMLAPIVYALLGASCARMDVSKGYRTAPGEGTAAHPAPPERLMIGNEMSLPSLSGQGQREPAIAYGSGVYLVVWREGFNGYQGQSDILAMRLMTYF